MSTRFNLDLYIHALLPKARNGGAPPRNEGPPLGLAGAWVEPRAAVGLLSSSGPVWAPDKGGLTPTRAKPLGYPM